MTDAQRSTVRKCIAGILKNKAYISLDHVPAFPGNTSNWDMIHANMLPMALSIEGEEGCDPAVYKRMVTGLKKWVYIAAGPNGAPFEGLNKSFYGARWLGDSTPDKITEFVIVVRKRACVKRKKNNL